MKSRFYSMVIKYRKPIMIIYVMIAIVCAVLQKKVLVDYDILDYLPKESPSTIALDVMEKEFGSNIPNTRVMIRDVDQKGAKDYQKKLAEIDGVVDVQWVDSLLPLNMPLEMLPKSMVETYYKDGNALFIVTVDSDRQLDAIPAIYDLVGEDNLVTGNAVTTVVATLSFGKEIALITVISILFLTLVLLLTTGSWIEPLIVLIGLGISVVMNSGTNLMFGKVSFITNSAGMILQMAVSLDYSVFLIHRYAECREHAEPEEAMHEALMLSSSSILSSGLTTVIGFAALATMRFLIGADLGLALSKGIAISLLTSLVFVPCVVLTLSGVMDKTSHRRLLPSFRRFGEFVNRVTVPLMIAFVIAIIPSFIGSINNDYWYGGSHIYGPETRVGADTEKLKEVFGDNDTYVLMVPRGDASSEHALIRELEATPKVKSVLSPVSAIGPAIPAEVLPDSILSQLRSDDYDRMVVSVAVPVESEESFALIDQIKKTCEKYYPDTYQLAGTGVSNHDLKNVVTGDLVKVNLVAVLAVFLVLILTMRNLVLPIILVLTIETAIWVNLSIALITGDTLFYLAYLIISSVQLGATVDYAILFTQRYRENRLRHGLSPKESTVQTISDTTVSIMVSALAVSVMGFLMGVFSTQGMIAQVGMLLSRGTICSLIAVLFVLPGMLMSFDRFVLYSFGSGRVQDNSNL